MLRLCHVHQGQVSWQAKLLHCRTKTWLEIETQKKGLVSKPTSLWNLTHHIFKSVQHMITSCVRVRYHQKSASTNERIDYFSTQFPRLENGPNLLNSMQLAPLFGGGSPSTAVTTLLHAIGTADPKSGAFSDDDLGRSWGHAQFKDWREALKTWQDVGSPEIACQLIAAMIKTTQVARALCCEERNKQSSPILYLSDSQLELLTDQLWTLWRDAGGVS
jgi:hypothetical protein